MSISPEAKTLPPVFLTFRNQPSEGQPVADIQIRDPDGNLYEAPLWAGKTRDGQRQTLSGIAQPADGNQRLNLIFDGAQRQLAAPQNADSGYQNRPGHVLLFRNDRGAPLSGYFTHPETGEVFRPSVFFKPGQNYGTGPLQTEQDYRAALEQRQAAAASATPPLDAAAGTGAETQPDGPAARRRAQKRTGPAPDGGEPRDPS